jgi:hypothetical protein
MTTQRYAYVIRQLHRLSIAQSQIEKADFAHVKFLDVCLHLQTLNAFIGEAGLAPDAGSVSEGDSITIEQILQEKKTFDLSINFEKLRLDGGERGWLVPCKLSVLNTIHVANQPSTIRAYSIEYTDQIKHSKHFTGRVSTTVYA